MRNTPKSTRLFSVAVVLIVVATATMLKNDHVETLAVTGVASCNKHDHDQSFWPTIGRTLRNISSSGGRSSASAAAADAFIWLGDVIYADTRVMPGWWEGSSRALMQEKYRQAHDDLHYRAFVENDIKKETVDADVFENNNKQEQQQVERPRVYGVWDDHDFGSNDGGVEYEDKDYVQGLFLDWLEAPKNDPRRRFASRGSDDEEKEQKDEWRKGMYTFHRIPFSTAAAPAEKEQAINNGASILPHPREEYESAICVVLLDVRYFRDPISPDRTGDMLGEVQWQWLRKTLENEVSDYESSSSASEKRKKKPCLATVIGSGVQVLPDTLPTEQWGNFPKSRDRLIHEIRRAKVQRVVFLSGDVHFGELVIDKTTDVQELMGGFPAVEMTTSGLTHSSGELPPIRYLFNDILPSSRRHSYYLFKNFGSVEVRRRLVAVAATATGGEDEQQEQKQHLEIVLRVHRIEDGAVVAELKKDLNEDLEAKKTTKVDEMKKVPEEPQQFPDSEYPPIKKLLLFLKKNLFPTLRLHQVIYMVIFGGMGLCAVVGICVVVALCRCVWRCCGCAAAPSVAKTKAKGE